eukprot:4689295-Amphidinium_carterae.1
MSNWENCLDRENPWRDVVFDLVLNCDSPWHGTRGWLSSCVVDCFRLVLVTSLVAVQPTAKSSCGELSLLKIVSAKKARGARQDASRTAVFYHRFRRFGQEIKSHL